MSKSTDLNTGKEYAIPGKINDINKINKFLSDNAGKKIIVIQGLGFVGAVMAIVCANAKENYAVIGVDLPNKNSYWKVQGINNGSFPVKSSDVKINIYYQKAMRNKNLIATCDEYAYSVADYIIVDINLDVIKYNSLSTGKLTSYEVNLNNFNSAIKSIAKKCKESSTILIESTVPPGTTSEVVVPIFRSIFKERDLNFDNLKIGHSYERVMPGENYIDSIVNYYRVYSGVNENSEVEIKNFLESIISTDNYPLTKLSNTNATEIAKVLENSYRAMNISFIIEWSRFAELANVNLYEVIDAIKMRPTHKNIMYPGIGVGGYCLTKDPLLASWSKQNIFKSKYSLEMSEKSVSQNDMMPYYAFINIGKKINLNELNSVLIFGVSYRADVGDTRYSPVYLFKKLFENINIKCYCHDPFVKYWNEIDESVYTEITNINKTNFDIIVITTNHKEYKKEKFEKFILSQDNSLIYDTVGCLDENQINLFKNKHKVTVLGRGDL